MPRLGRSGGGGRGSAAAGSAHLPAALVVTAKADNCIETIHISIYYNFLPPPFIHIYKNR